ncbi:MAG: proteophosphoglycan ppg4 [Pseudomonadota bacterium]
MNASIQLKTLVASLAAVAFVGTALAQGNPPNPSVSNPAQGAGQQSSQTTPMGTTGTPGGSGSTMGASTPTTGSTAGSGTTMGASSSTDTSAAATTTTTKKSKVKAKRKHVARSDRG